MMKKKSKFQDSMKTLIEGKIFNGDVSLEKLIEVSSKLEDARGEKLAEGWCFITEHYVYYGEDKTIREERKY